MFFDSPVEPCAEIIGKLHLQRLIGILEGGKLAEEVPHFPASTSLNLDFLLEIQFLPFPPWQ